MYVSFRLLKTITIAADSAVAAPVFIYCRAALFTLSDELPAKTMASAPANIAKPDSSTDTTGR